MRRFHPLSLLVGVVFLGAPPDPAAATFDLAIDVPARLGAVDFTPDQLLRVNAGAYSLLAQLPAGTALGAVHRNPDGSWLLTPDRPTDLGAVLYEPRDVVRWDGVAYALHLDGTAAGIPADSRIDALMVDAAGRTVVSFDVPTTIGASTFLPADLVRYEAGAFTIDWAGAAAGVPVGTNLVGAARTPPGDLIVTFDVPLDLGGVDYLPGQLLAWAAGTGFALFASDPSWPSSSQLRDFALLPPAGAGSGLRVRRSGSDVTLEWSASCAATDTDYGVYEGTLGSFTSHAPRLCSTGGLTTATITPAGAANYYLVVPRNAVSEGSYGLTNGGTERPPSTSQCLPQTNGACAAP